MTYQIDELLNTAPCGFLSFIDDGTIVIANATLLELLGHEPDGLRGRKIESILPIASRIFYQTHFFPLLKLHGKAEEIYFSLRPRQGSDIPMLVNAVRREKAGSFVNNCIFIPIRQRIQYEDEILQAKKVAETAIRAQKQAEIALRQQYERAILLREISQRIYQFLDLSKIFEIASHEIRELIHADRVGIFKFSPNAHHNDGEFVAESVLKGFDSHLATKIHDHCFGKQYASYYRQGRIQAVDDIDNAGLTECYRGFLAQLQIRANLVVPLLNGGDDLWGLLYIHQCSAPRHWQEIEIDLIKQIANQLAIAIQKADIFQKLQKELAERQQAETRLTESNQQLAFSNEELACATRLLEKLVNIDGLTQIANRRCFDDRLEQEWARLYREQEPLSLLLFDVDYFKRYNDSYGHQLGDECLTKLAQAAQQVVWRPADLVARYGGEEFVIILPNTDQQGAMAVAERIHLAIKALGIPHQTSDVSDVVTISLGIAVLIPSPELSPAILIAQADQALYCAKKQGRNQSVIYPPPYQLGYGGDIVSPSTKE
ncbi:diguanylate cyclase domain-containing protein [Cylindrospermum sp. FACHB-282]|uniref:diguanylate cyclase domain-containing protein n=1 Tax=Cylindrospermum sp. FACHB-282 TaxID=2692794 RepID=UPI001681E04F|nr:diguanylate cyclase [Cylindrospermum sp. FACHB-282]MBD2386106.1 diguanylate cyclase [Cylindrospermum sp. FACHB-282]